MGSVRTHCARRPSCEIVTRILSAKLVQETSVGTPLTSPSARREEAGKGSSLASLGDAIVCGRQLSRDVEMRKSTFWILSELVVWCTSAGEHGPENMKMDRTTLTRRAVGSGPLPAVNATPPAPAPAPGRRYLYLVSTSFLGATVRILNRSTFRDEPCESHAGLAFISTSPLPNPPQLIHDSCHLEIFRSHLASRL